MVMGVSGHRAAEINGTVHGTLKDSSRAEVSDRADRGTISATSGNQTERRIGRDDDLCRLRLSNVKYQLR